MCLNTADLTKPTHNEIIEQTTQGDNMAKIDMDKLELIGSFGVDSGQAMVGDPCYLDEWKTNRDEEWDLAGKIGQYSYQGASATTIDSSAGVLGNGRSVVFNTGYGDGVYPVYAEFNDDGRVARIVIEFVSDEE
jgi:hypothetical protein